jgi:hypothetical protein
MKCMIVVSSSVHNPQFSKAYLLKVGLRSAFLNSTAPVPRRCDFDQIAALDLSTATMRVASKSNQNCDNDVPALQGKVTSSHLMMKMPGGGAVAMTLHLHFTLLFDVNCREIPC